LLHCSRDIEYADNCSAGPAAAVRIVGPRGDWSNIMMNWRTTAPAACAAAAMGMPVANAQTATALEQTELAGLRPDIRAQVQARAVGGNSVTEVLQVCF
jgi:hypothetical protein